MLTDEYQRYVTQDPLFWYVGLYTIINNHGLVHEAEFAEGIPSLLETMFRAPRKFSRKKCHKSLLKLRTSLSKYIAPHIGHIPMSELAGVNEIIVDAETDPECLSVYSYVLARQRQETGSSWPLNNKVKTSVQYLCSLMTPILTELLDSFCRIYSTGKDGDALTFLEFHGLGESGKEDSQPEEDDSPQEALLNDFEPEEILWRYVEKPENGSERYSEIKFTTASELAVFFRKKRIPISIKEESIINAVQYFRGVPDADKNTMIKEQVGSLRWNKVKRGKMRILLLEEGDQIYVNVYPRKEWEYKGN